uniref:C-type lectin domain-containing protein n=1 Tax=Panagrolaimus davidi TaxID=227884 RepID=A0A914QWT1_9BILA
MADIWHQCIVFAEQGNEDFWIGANRLLTPGIWGWIDGSPFTFTDWDKGQPNNVSGADCGSMTIPGGTWTANPCYSEKPFICSINVAPTPLPKKCPNNWCFFDKTGYCYFVGTNKTWGESEDYCISQNSHLASIHSLDENSFVTNIIPFNPNNHACNVEQFAWIGLFTVTNKTDWRWIDGTSYNYSLWAPGRPSGVYSIAYCVVLWNGPSCSAPLETWADGNCGSVYGFYICKKLPS